VTSTSLSKSQESFNINLALAPSCVVNAAPGTSTQQLANPQPTCSPNLAPGQSYLYIWPCAAKPPTGSCPSPNRVALAPGQHWREVASSNEVLTGPAPGNGGLASVLQTVGGGLYPVSALADAPQPLGREITCTVIYYFQPATPLIFGTGQVVYIVGTSTMQATY
jgi:hypothetical protein